MNFLGVQDMAPVFRKAEQAGLYSHTLTALCCPCPAFLAAEAGGGRGTSCCWLTFTGTINFLAWLILLLLAALLCVFFALTLTSFIGSTLVGISVQASARLAERLEKAVQNLQEVRGPPRWWWIQHPLHLGSSM